MFVWVYVRLGLPMYEPSRGFTTKHICLSNQSCTFIHTSCLSSFPSFYPHTTFHFFILPFVLLYIPNLPFIHSFHPFLHSNSLSTFVFSSSFVLSYIPNPTFIHSYILPFMLSFIQPPSLLFFSSSLSSFHIFLTFLSFIHTSCLSFIYKNVLTFLLFFPRILSYFSP